MSGGRLLLLQEHTFSTSNGRNYYCSKKDQGCKARVKLENKQIVVLKPEHLIHNHLKPDYFITSSGMYVKVSQ